MIGNSSFLEVAINIIIIIDSQSDLEQILAIIWLEVYCCNHNLACLA